MNQNELLQAVAALVSRLSAFSLGQPRSIIETSIDGKYGRGKGHIVVKEAIKQNRIHEANDGGVIVLRKGQPNGND